MSKTENHSAIKMWEDFVESNPGFSGMTMPSAWHFCDKEKAADELAELVVNGIKQATCSLLMEYQLENEDLPKEGQLDIVTDWAGNAKAIIKIIKVELIPFDQVTEDFARQEGEGDRTLKYWKESHWNFFERTMHNYGKKPMEDMMLVCEQFEKIWPCTQST